MSREASFLYNNLLLVAFCLTILWGVLYPILTEALRGEPVTVGPPYYNFFLRAFGLPLFFLMGIGPLIAWRRASLRGLGGRSPGPPPCARLGVILVALGAGPDSRARRVHVLRLRARVHRARVRPRQGARRALGSSSWPGAFSSLVGRNRRRYGGYVVHVSIVLLAIGIVGSSAYDTISDAQLRPGQSMSVAGYDLRYRGVRSRVERTRRRSGPSWTSRGTVRCSGRCGPARIATSPSSRSRTRPRSGRDRAERRGPFPHCGPDRRRDGFSQRCW